MAFPFLLPRSSFKDFKTQASPPYSVTMDVGEDENVTFLTSMMGDGDPDIARRVLRKHNGDVHKAATSILEGDTGAEESWPTNYSNLVDVPASVTGPSTPPRKWNDAIPLPVRILITFLASKPERDKSIIDLTGDEESSELRRALEASLSTSAYGPSATQFGPSQRAPDPNWAMVPSNVCFIWFHCGVVNSWLSCTGRAANLWNFAGRPTPEPSDSREHARHVQRPGQVHIPYCRATR